MQVDNTIINFLCKKKISYMSYSLLSEEKSIATYCNDKKWLDFYKKTFVKNMPPVYKYIFLSNNKALIWELIDLDKTTRDYISTRNEVVGVSSNITLIFERGQKLSVITLGTSEEKSYLMSFLNENADSLNLIENRLLSLAS